jgi:hypothetical protein
MRRQKQFIYHDQMFALYFHSKKNYQKQTAAGLGAAVLGRAPTACGPTKQVTPTTRQLRPTTRGPQASTGFQLNPTKARSQWPEAPKPGPTRAWLKRGPVNGRPPNGPKVPQGNKLIVKKLIVKKTDCEKKIGQWCVTKLIVKKISANGA